VFTDSPFQLIQAAEQHRDHAIEEQVFADVASGPRPKKPRTSRRTRELQQNTPENSSWRPAAGTAVLGIKPVDSDSGTLNDRG
jgi:hypothetical protein